MKRFWNKVEKRDYWGCWDWTAAIDDGGYGRFRINGKTVYAHRFSYESLVGPIPADTVLDHLCRNKKCVNPSHLEPVSNKVNILRGESPSAKAARRNTCSRGHPYDEENTRHRSNGQRSCRACDRLWRENRRRKNHV